MVPVTVVGVSRQLGWSYSCRARVRVKEETRKAEGDTPDTRSPIARGSNLSKVGIGPLISSHIDSLRLNTKHC